MRGLNGLRILVTGAAGGIGRQVVHRLVQEGSSVAVTDMTAPEIDGTKFSSGADVTDADEVVELVARAEEALGGLDAVVTAAGVQVTGATHEMNPADFRWVIEVNLIGTFLTLRASLPGMLQRESGRVITFGSTAALVGAPGLAAYAASKGAVLQLTRSIAAEYARRGVRANCICPGGTLTPLLADIEAKRDDHDFRDRHPIGRFADPTEIAAAAAFLLSDDASFVLGAAFVVDGGFTCA